MALCKSSFFDLIFCRNLSGRGKYIICCLLAVGVGVAVEAAVDVGPKMRLFFAVDILRRMQMCAVLDECFFTVHIFVTQRPALILGAEVAAE